MTALTYYQTLIRLLEKAIPCVQVTLVDMLGSAPQNIGAKMLVTPEGLHTGTVGGGKIEAHCIALAQNLLQAPPAPSSAFYEWNLQTEIGMTCGGVVRVYFEVFQSNTWPIAIFGAGHLAQALVPLLSQLKCQLWCFDSRAEWLEKLSPAPNLTLKLSPDPQTEVANLPPNCFIVSMTMGHAHDLPILAAAFRRKYKEPEAFPFIGVVGSHAKAGIIQRDLKGLDISPELTQQLVCPVGLPLGDNSPPEIAISISAQLIQERDRLLGYNLKWQKPIHQYHRKKAQGEKKT